MDTPTVALAVGSACVCKSPMAFCTCTATSRCVELQTYKLLHKYDRAKDVHCAVASDKRERYSRTLPLLVELLRAHTFVLVDLQAIAAKTPVVRYLRHLTGATKTSKTPT